MSSSCPSKNSCNFRSVSIENSGSLEIILGPMFSGKTSYLLRELNIYSVLGLKVLYINSSFDTRSTLAFSTHNPTIKSIGNIDSVYGSNLQQFVSLFSKYDVIGIDEAQFFPDIKGVVLDLVEKENKRVLVAGLVSNFRREIFGEIIYLITYCDSIIKLSSFCKVCSENRVIRQAHFTCKTITDTDIIDVGSGDKYLPLCRPCYLSLSSN